MAQWSDCRGVHLVVTLSGIRLPATMPSQSLGASIAEAHKNSWSIESRRLPLRGGSPGVLSAVDLPCIGGGSTADISATGKPDSSMYECAYCVPCPLVS